MAPVLHATTEDITAAVYICTMTHAERREEELYAQKMEQNVLIYPVCFCNKSMFCFAVTGAVDQ